MNKKILITIIIIFVIASVFIWQYFLSKEKAVTLDQELEEMIQEDFIEGTEESEVEFFGETGIIPEINVFKDLKINPFN